MSAVADVTGEDVLSLVVNRVLNALPTRLVPSRSFLTASIQIVEALINAWFDVHQSLAPETEVRRWGPIVGDACARAWWQDAAEQQASAPEVLVAVLSRGQSPPEEARHGAAFICCALDDAVGSAGAALSKAQLAGRPNTGLREVSRSEFRPPSRAGAKAGDRYKLLGIKHFVAAAKADEDLQNCPLIATCLADVAIGGTPYLEVELLLGVPTYRARLVAWASQESQGDGPALQEAISQAMKVSAASVTSAPNAAYTNKGQLRQVKPESKQSDKEHKECQGRRASWLPQAFVTSFNAEGEEVEGVDDAGENMFSLESPQSPKKVS